MKKEIKKEIDELLIEKSFLARKDVELISNKFSVLKRELVKQIQKSGIPCITSRAKDSLLGMGIIVENNKVLLNEFNKLGEWRKEVFKSSKIKVVFKCRCCGVNGESRIAHIVQRKFFVLEPICSKCIEKEVANTKEWKKTNSDAQLIAQNKPEQLEKNRQAQIERFKNEDVRVNSSIASKSVWERPGFKEKMVIIAKKKWDDPVYARKVIENSKNGGLKGIYNKIYYDSGYELAWLMMMESKGNLEKVKRANIYISYKNKNEKICHYYPDFILDEKYLIEVKGYGPWADIENINLKNKVAKIWCKENKKKYRLIELKDFGYYWYRKARIIHKELANGKTQIKNNNSI